MPGSASGGLLFHFKESTGSEGHWQPSEDSGEDCSVAPSWRVTGVCPWAQKRADGWKEKPGCAHSLSPSQQLGGGKGPEGHMFHTDS